MPEFAAWLNGLPGKPVFVGYPVAYDFMFMHWYLIKFAGGDPFGHAALDIKSYAMAVLKSPYTKSGKHHMPKNWLSNDELAHVALDDAIEQGRLFCKMLASNSK